LTVIALLLRLALRALQKSADQFAANPERSSDAKPSEIPINQQIQ